MYVYHWWVGGLVSVAVVWVLWFGMCWCDLVLLCAGVLFFVCVCVCGLHVLVSCCGYWVVWCHGVVSWWYGDVLLCMVL